MVLFFQRMTRMHVRLVHVTHILYIFTCKESRRSKNHTRASLTTLQMLSSKRNKIIIPRNIEDDIEEDGFIRMCVFVTVSLRFKLPWTEIPVVLKTIVAFLMKRQRIYLGNINFKIEKCLNARVSRLQLCNFCRNNKKL